MDNSPSPQRESLHLTVLKEAIERNPYRTSLRPKLATIAAVAESNDQIRTILEQLQHPCAFGPLLRPNNWRLRKQRNKLHYFLTYIYFASDDFAQSCAVTPPPTKDR